jgi:glutaredoxin
MAKAFLKSQNIPFEEKDVLTDLTAREDMVKKSGQLGVPVIDVDGKIMVGFDQAELTKLISNN